MMPLDGLRVAGPHIGALAHVSREGRPPGGADARAAGQALPVRPLAVVADA